MRTDLSRKLAVIVHADVAGSTALVRQDEAIAHERMQDAFTRLSETITVYNGTTHEIRGDALVAEFDRASDAIAAAVSFQQANSAKNLTLPDDLRPGLRVGIAMGEVVVADRTVTGEGIVLAQRIEQLVEPGDVGIQSAAYETVPSRLRINCENLGEYQLKGFDEPVRIYAIRMDATEVDIADRGHARTELSLPDAPSIAILPFTNMSSDPEQDYFSDGVTEDIITALSQLPGLFVIARNSSFSYKGESVDIQRVAAELGVRYVLEGSVRRSGHRLRVTAQLIDSRTTGHIWAERFDGDLSDVFDFQDEITRQVVGGISPQIELAEFRRASVLRAADMTSYDLALRAQAAAYDAIRAGDPDGVRTAIAMADEALALDPRSVRALWTQAYGYAYIHLQRWTDDPATVLDTIKRTASRLIQADPSSSFGYLGRGLANQLDGQYDAAVTDYRRALELGPNMSKILAIAAWGESLAGLTTEAKRHAEMALRLSPRDLDMVLGESYLALFQAAFAERDFDAAENWGRMAIQMHATAPIRRVLMVAVCTFKGDDTGAMLHANALNAFAPNFISAIAGGDMRLFKDAATNQLVVDGLRQAGLVDRRKGSSLDT